MLLRIITAIFCVVALSSLSPAFASEWRSPFEDKPATLTFFVGEKTWLSTGDNKWNLAGTGGTPNILSELELLELDSTVVEIFGGIRSGTAALTVRFGFGSMEDSIYRDSDYLSNDRQGIYSLSTGTADGKDWDDLYYYNIDYSYRLLSRKSEHWMTPRYLDFVIGYQQRHEVVTMTNGLQEICVAPCTGGTGPFAGLNSHYTFDWKSILIGLEGSLPLFRGLTLKGNTLFIPYTNYSGEGVWNLRNGPPSCPTCFKQNPSFTHKADGGYGGEIDVSLSYRIKERFEIGVGYRYWFIKSGDGTDTTFFSSGAIGVTQFNEAVSERQGAFLDLTYQY